MTGGQRQLMLCPNCGKLISTSEPRCPYCGIRRPASMGKRLMGTVGLSDPDRLIRDELITLFFAGAETTALVSVPVRSP